MYAAFEWVSGIISFFTGDGTQEIWIFEGRSGSLDREEAEPKSTHSRATTKDVLAVYLPLCIGTGQYSPFTHSVYHISTKYLCLMRMSKSRIG